MPTWEELQARAQQYSPNPLVLRYGAGPEGATCGACVHHWRASYHGKRYGKCNLRPFTHGAGSDHRAKWPACKRFIPEQGERGVYVGYRQVGTQGQTLVTCLEHHDARSGRWLPISRREAEAEQIKCQCGKPLVES